MDIRCNLPKKGIWNLATNIWMDQNQEEVDELQKWWFGGDQIVLLHHGILFVKVLQSCTILQSSYPAGIFSWKIMQTWIMFGGGSHLESNSTDQTCQEPVSKGSYINGYTYIVIQLYTFKWIIWFQAILQWFCPAVTCIRSCFLTKKAGTQRHKRSADEGQELGTCQICKLARMAALMAEWYLRIYWYYE